MFYLDHLICISILMFYINSQSTVFCSNKHTFCRNRFKLSITILNFTTKIHTLHLEQECSTKIYYFNTSNNTCYKVFQSLTIVWCEAYGLIFALYCLFYGLWHSGFKFNWSNCQALLLFDNNDETKGRYSTIMDQNSVNVIYNALTNPSYSFGNFISNRCLFFIIGSQFSLVLNL